MDKKPVSYLQTDPRWANISYSAKGESTTIGRAGCGPTAMSMVLATWANKNVTPKTECAWALVHGYKAPHQGTYYSYFVPAARRHGLQCWQVNTTSIYGNTKSPHHETARKAIENGRLVIACMGKGLWTSSGHYVLVWKIQGNTIYINDPASTRLARTQGDYSLFKQQVKYYWVIEAPKTKKEEPDMTEKEVKSIIDGLSDEAAYRLYTKAMRHLAKQPEPDWSREQGNWRTAVEKGVFDGSRPESPITRAETAAVLKRVGALD